MKPKVVQPLKLIAYLVGIHVISVVTYEPTHLQDIFCQSDFVIMARVQNEAIGKCKCSYKLDVLEKYKKSCKSEAALKKKVVGTKVSNGTYCVDLKMGHEYILAGNVNNGLAHIHPDLVPIKATDLTDFQEDALRGIYAYNCRCKVLVYPLKRLPKNGHNFCLWNTYNEVLYKEDCQMRYSACTFNKRRQACSWRNDETFFKCDRKTEVFLEAASIVSYIKNLSPFLFQKFIGGRKDIIGSKSVEDSMTDTAFRIHSEIPQQIFTDTESDTGSTR